MAIQGQNAAPLFGINPDSAVDRALLLVLIATTLSAVPAALAQTLPVLYSFGNGDVGNTPASGLIMDQAGRLYGTASSGGMHGNGTAYRLSRAGSGWTVAPLYSFQGGMDGAIPWPVSLSAQTGRSMGRPPRAVWEGTQDTAPFSTCGHRPRPVKRRCVHGRKPCSTV